MHACMHTYMHTYIHVCVFNCIDQTLHNCGIKMISFVVNGK